MSPAAWTPPCRAVSLPHESSGLDTALQTLRSFRDSIEEAPHKVRVMCQIGGAAVVLNGLLGVLDVGEVFDHAIYYTMNLYAVFFGIVTIVTETHPDNGTPALYDNLKSVQQWMLEWAKGLTMLR